MNEITGENSEKKENAPVAQGKIEAQNSAEPRPKSTGNFFKKYWFVILVVILLALIVYFGCYIRTTNISSLKDVTTGNYTLGPDLDPFLYLRFAKEIASGTYSKVDMMAMAPLGTSSYAQTSLMPWAIAYMYKALSPFLHGSQKSVEFVAVIAPVIFSGLAFILFFLFVYVLFTFFMKKRFAGIGALVATLFYIVAPEMLHRTTGGIPEIESLGMVFFWAALLFLMLAWKQEKIKKMITPGILSGIFTGVMAFCWGGFRYILMSLGVATLLIFLFNKEKKKTLLIFASWFIPTFIFSLFRSGLNGTLLSFQDTGFCTVILFILIIDQIVFNTKLKKIKEKIKIPESIISIIIGAVIILLGLLIFKSSIISQAASLIFNKLLNPFGTGRISLTVAENSAPYFLQVLGSFNWFFWAFFFGTLLLFYEAIKHFDVKKRWIYPAYLAISFVIWLLLIFSKLDPAVDYILLAIYIIISIGTLVYSINKKDWNSLLNTSFSFLLFNLIFSRISGSDILNGENVMSNALYFGGIIVFAAVILYMCIYSYVKKEEKLLDDFKKINFAYVFLLAFFFWMIVSMRGAVRLFFIVSPAVVIASAFLPVKLSEYVLTIKKNWHKILIGALVILVAVFLIVNFLNNEKASSQEAKATVNSAYYEQWQKAMSWVRTDTPENSIFVHWWDYGYWVQTLGERPTVTDGGHWNAFWDHTTARYLMTAQNESTALQLCKAYNVSYFLLDSSDIGKYSAFASIGSDKTGTDRLSWISTFALDQTQTQETKNETVYVYANGNYGTAIDQDILWNGQLFPMQRAGIGVFLLTIDKSTQSVRSLEAVMVYNGQQYRIPVRYLWVNGKTYDMKQGNEKMLESMLYIIPSISQTGENNLGIGLYLSEKALNTEWVRLYLLDKTENFELVHNEPSPFVQQLRTYYNLTIGDIVYAGGIQGPIKIWKVNYLNDTPYYKEYLETNVDITDPNTFGKLDYLGL
jgi:asparagine N-glycosylation enzyme membrane subunit Stt3